MNYYATPWFYMDENAVSVGVNYAQSKEFPSITDTLKTFEKRIENFKANKLHIVEIVEISEREFERLTK